MAALVYCECDRCECQHMVAIDSGAESDEFGSPICEECTDGKHRDDEPKQDVGADPRLADIATSVTLGITYAVGSDVENDVRFVEQPIIEEANARGIATRA